MEIIGLKLAGDMIAVALEQRNDVPIFRGDVRLENSDAVIAGGIDQAFDQPGADTFAAVGVIDDDGNLSGIFPGQTVIAPDCHNLAGLLFKHLANKGKAVFIIDRTEPEGIFGRYLLRYMVQPEIAGIRSQSSEKSQVAFSVFNFYWS